MNDKLMDALAQWPRSVKFGGKYAGMEDKLNAELERRKEELAAQADDLLTSTRRAQHMPTVDTAEVVRCRDCVHFGECLVTENDYCSKGERKEKY